VASPLLDFCKDSVASAPDLPPVGSDNPTIAPKRRRIAAGHEVGSEPKQTQKRVRGKIGAAKAAQSEEGTADAVDAAEESPADIVPYEAAATTIYAAFLGAAPGQEAEEEDYDA
jgi:hypothetical protein